MGDLVTQTPYSEITATLEVLDRWDVKREHLTKFRGASSWFQQQIAAAIISSEESFFAEKIAVPQVSSLTLSFPAIQLGENFENWLQQVQELERQCHFGFFGQEFDLTDFKATLGKYGPEKIKGWLALDLEPHFLPKAMISRDAGFPGWKVRPNDWYWQQLAAGKILRDRSGELVADKTAELEGITVLVDTRLKPRYKNGKQMWEGDTLLGPLLIQLREAGKIAEYEYGTQGSRFGVSADEWENEVKSALAGKLSLPANQVLLESVIVANTVPQIYSYMPRRDDGKTNTWVWYEEYFEDRSDRLFGGLSGSGGLAGVDWHEAWYHWVSWSFRPLAVL